MKKDSNFSTFFNTASKEEKLKLLHEVTRKSNEDQRNMYIEAKIKCIVDDVIAGKFGTKNKAELYLRLEELKDFAKK